jgi:hypothetical protein
MFSNFFSVEKCDRKTSFKIQISLLLLFIICYLLIVYSPFVYFFKLLGYENSNGCPLYTLTGIPCPTCGLGRTLYEIVHLHLDKLFYFNPSAPFIYIVLLVILLSILILSFFNYRIKIKPLTFNLWFVAVFLIIIVWVLNLLFGHVEL